MSEIYTVIIGILGVLAISGLFVGVTNDAVNFLNSAIGSKVASMKVILSVASVGILIGVVTSSGMMEVARSGMFNPGLFTFHEVMMLYLGVMFANVILLDLYNSWGLPTSTTVSLIFCLLGSAIAVSIYKISNDPALGIGALGEYINTSRAMGIVSAILLSVVIAFTCGTIVMYISRLIFSFRYTATFRRYGALWCGASLTSIVYFALFKGLKTVLDGHAFIEFVDRHLLLSLLACWIVCSLALFFIQRLKINILRITILSGTFALALAFAGNDLVNFSFGFFPDFEANQLKNQKALKNVSVDLGAGDDTFHFWGEGAMDVSDGAGNDALYVGQKLPAATPADYNAVWVFNVKDAKDATQTGIFIGPDGAQSLENNLLGGETSFDYNTGPATDRISLKAEVSFKGITASATLELKPGKGQLSDTDINHLLIKAINEDATLSKLLLAKDGAGSSLLVEALYNGEMKDGDLKFGFSAVKQQDGSAATGVTLDDNLTTGTGSYVMGGGHAAFASNGTTTGTVTFTGSNVGTDSATTIHMGLGNDVIALNAADGTAVNPSNDTLVLNGAFGHDVVMNFTTLHDKIDATAGKYANSTFNALYQGTGGKPAIKIDDTDAYYGLLAAPGTVTLDKEGTTLLVVENAATTDVNDYWFFEVTSKDTTLDKDDTITLLGTITTGKDAIAAGDIDIA